MVLVITMILMILLMIVYVYMVSMVVNANMIIDHVNLILVGIKVYTSIFYKKNLLDFLFIGKCSATSNTTFMCSCSPGWEGIHCELQTNYCENITCEIEDFVAHYY